MRRLATTIRPAAQRPSARSWRAPSSKWLRPTPIHPRPPAHPRPGLRMPAGKPLPPIQTATVPPNRQLRQTPWLGPPGRWAGLVHRSSNRSMSAPACRRSRRKPRCPMTPVWRHLPGHRGWTPTPLPGCSIQPPRQCRYSLPRQIRPPVPCKSCSLLGPQQARRQQQPALPCSHLPSSQQPVERPAWTPCHPFLQVQRPWSASPTLPGHPAHLRTKKRPRPLPGTRLTRWPCWPTRTATGA